MKILILFPNISHRGITGNIDSGQISNLLDGSGSGTLKIELWINNENSINALTVDGKIIIDSSEYTKLNLSPE